MPALLHALAIAVLGAPDPTPAPEHELDPRAPPAPIAVVDPGDAEIAIVDEILPSGVRLIVVQDASLPVAAVLLALEGDALSDPPELPGLAHALAHHILQGNREIPPLGSAAATHDAGGVAFLAVTPGLVRFESLIPVSELQSAIVLESRRLRAPTVSTALWRDTLMTAGREPRRPTAGADLELLALLHGRRPVPWTPDALDQLSQLTPPMVGTHLTRVMRYERATLVVVGATPPTTVRRWALQAFADLPSAPRDPTVSAPGTSIPAVPRRLTSARVSHPTWAFSLPATAGARFLARGLCRALDRQQRKAAARATRLRCRLLDDPRRPMLLLDAAGAPDPEATLTARLGELFTGASQPLWETSLRELTSELKPTLATPLSRARHLIWSGGPAARDAAAPPHGAAPLDAQELFDLRRATVVMPEKRR